MYCSTQQRENYSPNGEREPRNTAPQDAGCSGSGKRRPPLARVRTIRWVRVPRPSPPQLTQGTGCPPHLLQQHRSPTGSWSSDSVSLPPPDPSEATQGRGQTPLCFPPAPNLLPATASAEPPPKAKKFPVRPGGTSSPGAVQGGDEPPLCWVAPGRRCCFPGLSPSSHSSLLSIPFSLGACLSLPPSPPLRLGFLPQHLPLFPPLSRATAGDNPRGGWTPSLPTFRGPSLSPSEPLAASQPCCSPRAKAHQPYAWAPHGDAQQEGLHPGRVGGSGRRWGPSVRP